jgi:phosphatidylglycerol lysyltransferase
MNQQKLAMLSPGKKFRGKIALLFQNNTGIIIRFTLTGLFIGLAVWFFNHERTELRSVGHVLFSANPAWITAGLGLLILYIFLQGCMYVTSFASVDAKLNPWDATILFLKRNFVSVFIPAGGISSLAFFSSSVEKKGISRSQVYFASSIYAFVGILSVIIVAIPAFIFAVSGNGSKNTRWFALIGAILILVLIYFIYKSIITKKSLYRFIIKIYPRSEVFFDEISTNAIIPRYFLFTVIISVFIEFVGIAHVYVSMAALNLAPSLSIAIIAYIVVVLFLIISPFLRGLGAIEVSMSYLLIRSGFNNVEAISITLLFRFFEFWMPLFAGLLSFLIKIEKIILRILPSLLIFTLGIINIVSVLSPGAPEKLRVLRDYLFFDVVNFSNSFVMITGLFLLVTAAFMIKGLRMAWWFAIVLSFFSAVGHITKGINYVETIMALLVVFALLSTRKEYYVKSNPRVRSIGIQTALLTVAAIMVYGIIGFYFLDKKHFLIDFSIYQSVKYTLLNFILVGSKNLVPHDPFSLNFLYTIKIAGAASMVFLVYSLVRPFVFQNAPTPEEAEKASALLKAYGRSSLDYFKSYPDKQIFLTSDEVSFVSYKVSRNFAVVLEDPVSAGTEEMKKTIVEFRKFCYDNGLRDIYYRVPKNSLEVYRQVSRKALFIGQEGIIDLSAFTLEGGDRKSIRNAINKITEQGYTSHIHYPPIKDGLIQKLKAVSDEWLRSTERKEIVFSQGMFDEKEIKQQVILTVENHEEKIIAFLNIIPDFAKDEGTYDLLRKTQDAPNGIIDFILTELFKYFQSIGIRYVNLGFAPMSGLDDPQNFPEKSMKFAYERIRSFTHFKGQREYKEKFNPAWYDKYLIYDFDYDLISIPSILSRVIKP